MQHDKSLTKLVAVPKVRVIGYITEPFQGGRTMFTAKDIFPMSEDFMSESNVPKALVDDLIKNGWEDKDGNVYFSPNYHPEPVKGDDGNVYLCASDADMKDNGLLTDPRMAKAVEMLTD